MEWGGDRMFGKGLIKGLEITLKHDLEKDISIQYPEERQYLHDRFSGCLSFDFPNFIACGLCTKSCPNNVLSFETIKAEGAKKKQVQSYTIDLQYCLFFFFFSSRRRHTSYIGDWSSDVCSSDLRFSTATAALKRHNDVLNVMRLPPTFPSLDTP